MYLCDVSMMPENKEDSSNMAANVDNVNTKSDSQSQNEQPEVDIVNDSQDKNEQTDGPQPDTPGNVTPAFILTADIGNIDGYTLCLLINDQMQGKVTEGVQEVRGLWRVYMNTLPDKINLCNEGLTFRNYKVKVHMSNPFSTGAINAGIDIDNSDIQMVKLTIKDLFKSVAHSEVVNMLEQRYKLKLATEVKYANYRDHDKKLTSFMNYDRYVWVHPDQLKLPLPRLAQCGQHKCRIFYRGQFKPSKTCYNCKQDDHIGRNCPYPKLCKVCLTPGHEPGSPLCTYYTSHHNMRVFGGYEDPMSNHYEVEGGFEYKHVVYKTVENAWFFQKGNRNGQEKLAADCRDAPNAKEAKYLGKGIRCTSDWDHQPLAYKEMKDICRAKYSKEGRARDALKTCWENGLEIVEAVPKNDSSYWGTGLSKEATLHTEKEHWNGKNMLGKVLTELAIEFWGDYPEPKVSDHNSSYESVGSLDEEPNGAYAIDYHTRKDILESVDSMFDGPYGNASIQNTINAARQRASSLSRRPLARGRGGGGRGGRGTGLRTFAAPRGRSPLRRFHKKSSPRTPSLKRHSSDPLVNIRQKQIRSVDANLYSTVTKQKHSNGSDKFG